MAINFIKKEDLSHITRTTRQWETTIDRYEIIPKGVLCIELCNDKLTKIKIGNGHLIYEQLPYVSDVNLSDYYTKEETNTLLKNLKSIKIKGEASSLSDLPLRGNEEGDLWFVSKSDPDEHSRYDEYVWYNNKWESFGSSDIDLSEYAKKSYVDEHIQEVQNEITEIIESGYLHKHDNKDILDHTSAVYNVEKDNKLRDLHNYDDTELREKAHTHLNKTILDQTDAVYNRDKDDKLRDLHNYDDTSVKQRLSSLESVAHSHSNQDVLNRTTAAFTREQALTLLDCKDFKGTDGVHDGYHGFVPAPTKDDIGKVLGANGEWVEGGSSGGDVVTEGGGISITTDAQTGNKVISVNAGTGLEIDQQTGELNVTATGGDSIAEGSGIDITTDSQTGVKTISVDIGDGLQFNQNSEIEVNIGEGLSIDQSGEIKVNTSDGLSINQENELEVSLGNGLQFDSNDAIEVNVGDGLSINASDEVELDKATTTDIGGVKIGDGLSVESDGTVSVNVGHGLSINQTTGAVEADADPLAPATESTLGGVIVGNGINVSNTGNISINAGDGLTITRSGDLPTGYSPVLGIKSTSGGNQYINTGYLFKANSTVKITCKLYKAETATWIIPIGMRTSGTADHGFMFTTSWGDMIPSTGFNTPSMWVGGSYQNYPSPTEMIDEFYNDIVEIQITAAGLRCTNTRTGNIGTITPSHQFTGTATKELYVFAANDMNNGASFFGPMDVYSLEIYEDNTLICKYVPCKRNLDDKYGLYDMVNDLFKLSPNGNLFAIVEGTAPGSIGEDILNLIPATNQTIGGVIAGNGIDVDQNGVIDINTGDGLVIDSNDNTLNVNIGDGLQINQDGEVEIDPSIIPDSYEAGDGIEIIEVTHEDEFRVLNQEYFFDTHGLTCGLNARIWTTVNDGDILAAMCIHNNGGNQVPLFVGLTEDSVKVSQNYNSTILGPNGSFDYLGKTWYFTADYALSGTDGQDTQGHIQTLPTTYSFDSTPSNFVPAAKDLIDLAVLLPDVTIPTINAKIGAGLQFDTNGAIEVTGESGDSIDEGGGITITTDQQTGVKTIGVNAGIGLDIDLVTGELFVNGQLPEGTIIKKLTYVGDGSYTNSNIHFNKKPLAILSLYGCAGPTNLNIFISASPAPIDSPYLHGIWGGQSGTTGYEGTACRAEMSYDDSTNVLTLSHPSDEGIAFNISGQTYQLYYLTKGHTGSGTSETNEISVIRSFTYVGDGTNTNNIQFPETPDMIVSIYGPTSDGFIASSPVPITSTSIAGIYEYGSASRYGGVVSCGMSFNDSTNILTLSGGVDAGARFNISGAIYTVTYSVNETLSASLLNPGDGIDINSENEISVKIGNHLSFDQTTGDINVDDIIAYYGGAATEVVNSAEFTIDKIRWTVSAIRSNSGSEIWIQLRYFGFYDDSYNRFQVSSGVSTWSDGSTVEYYQNRTIESLIANTERLCAKTWNGVRTFAMTFNLTYDISSDDLKYFRYYTGDDESGRDPVSWTIEVHDKVADTWTQVQTVTGATVPTGRNQWTSYFDLNLPPSDGKKINVLVGDGLFIDSTNNDVNVKIGQALSINNSNEIDVNLGRALSINNNNEIDVDIATATSLGVVKAGSGLNIDEYGNLSTQAAPFRIGRALSLDDESVRLPAGYAKAKYVENPGGAGKRTGFRPSDYPNAKYTGSVSVESVGSSSTYPTRYVCGASGWSGALKMPLDGVSSGLPIKTFFYIGNGNNPQYTTTTFQLGERFDFEASPAGGFKINNELVQAVATPPSNFGTYYFTLFGSGASNGPGEPGFKGRMYYFRIYNTDDTLLANFVPAVRLGDNVVGFYNTVNNTFYSSETSTQFTTDMDDLDVDEPDWVLNANIATSNSLGVVKPSTGLVVNEHGALSLDKASASAIGGVKVGNNLSIDSNGVLSANIVNYSAGHAIEIVGDLSIDKFRWEITANAGDSMVAFRYFEYSDSDHVAFAIQAGTIAWSDGSTVSYPSGYDETFAGMMENRTKCTVTGWGGSKTLIMTFTLSQSIMLSNIAYFRWKTDDYMSGRQPTEFNIYAHDSINDEWILLKEVTDHSLVPSSSNTWSNYIEIEPEIEPGAINVKYGNGLTVNQNNELEVVNSGTEYTAGDGIDIDVNNEISVVTGDGIVIDENGAVALEEQPTEYRAGEAISIETVGGLQPTNYSNDSFVDSIASMNAGSIVKAVDRSSFTLTASYNDCYTRGTSGEANGSYPFNVKSSTKYRFAWDSADPTVHGKVYTYENGLYDAMMHEIDQYDSSYLEFTTSANTTFIQARFGVMYAGDSITYSNVRLYEVIEDEDQYDEISVKYGDGLTLNQNNELEVPVASSNTLGIVKIGHGVEIDPYGAINVEAMVPFVAGVGLELIPGSSSVDALPEGYGKVDYIETNGSAYTIINYVPNRNSKVVGTALFRTDNSDPVVFGCRKGGGNGQQFVLWFNRYSSAQAKVGFVYGTNTWSTSTDAADGKLITYTTGEQFSFLISVDDDCNINNTFVHNITDNGAPATDLNLGIFALAVTNSSIESDDTIFTGRMYDFKIYENNELVVNLVPAVRLEDTKVGFYDNIGNKFYASLGSNQFTTDMSTMVIDYQDTTLNVRLGEGLKTTPSNDINLDLHAGNGIDLSAYGSVLPTGYGELSYIEGNGNQWTQLNYYPTHDSRLVVDCISYETRKTDRALFGCREGTGGQPQFVLWMGQEISGKVTSSFVYGSNVWDDDYDTGISPGIRFTIDASYNGVYVNGDLFESITDQGNMPNLKVALFTVGNGDGSYISGKGMGKYRIFSFKIYEGNDLVVDLRPALSPIHIPGFYDVVNDEFYSSLTGTSFVYDSGSVVYPSGLQLTTKLGDGLAFDANGAITVAESADAFVAGDGIKFTNLSRTNKIKLVISAIRSTSQSGANAPYTQMRYVEFYDENLDPISIASGEAIWSDGTTVVYSEQIYSLSEMLSNTNKMCVCDYKPSLVLTFTLSSAMSAENIKYFRYKTGNDVSERDPVSWKIYVNDVNAQTSWTQISEAVSETITTSRDTWTQYFTCEFTAGGTTSISVLPATGSTLGGVIVGNGLTVTSDGTISTATGKAYIAGEGINMSSSQYEFSAENEEYLFRSKVTCELHGSFNREFQKTTDDTALGIIWNVYDSGTLWSGPIFVGLSSDAVKYTANGATYSALGTFSYLGKTWYYSDHSMYVSNIDGTDHDGNMVVDTETSASVSELVDFCKSLIDRARVILKVDEISLLPATEDTLGGIKIGEGLSIDENNVVSSTVYEEGQGIIFETSGSTDSFDVKNKQYYFEEKVSCQISGNFGPRTFTRLSDEPCLMALMKYNTSWCMPIIVGLTAESVDMSQSWDGTILHSKGTLDHKGYTWYVNADYGLSNGSMVDLMGNLQTLPDMYTYDSSSHDDYIAKIMDAAKDLIDLAELISPGIKTYDVWNTGTGWLNGAYNDSQSDYFWTNWYYTYHSKPDEYLEVPAGAVKMRLIGISNENDSRLQGGGVDCFNSSHHHFATVGCITDEWADIPLGTVYLQFGVKWNELNNRYISSSDIKSVTLEIKVPKNNAITAKLGDGLRFDQDDAITLDESIKLIIHCVGTPLT